MLNVVLMQPEIPQNTGNIARTCACADARLHLVHPMGFQLTERNIRRSGMDYLQHVDLVEWVSTQAFLDACGNGSLWLFTGAAARGYHEVRYVAAPAGDGVAAAAERREEDLFLVFGRESAGIDPEVLARYSDRCVRIPMVSSRRSLNLSNAVAIALYEAQRQLGFPRMK